METTFRKLKNKQKPLQLQRLNCTAYVEFLLLTDTCEDVHILTALEYSLRTVVLFLCGFIARVICHVWFFIDHETHDCVLQQC